MGQKSFDWCFIENIGQYNEEVTFKHSLLNGSMFLTETGITYHLLKENNSHSHSDESEIEMQHHAFSVDFIGANKQSIISKNKPSNHYFNFFIGEDKSKWASEVYGFESIKYNDIYNDIDFVMYDKNETIKYDFIVKKGGDAKNIKLKYNNLNNIYIDKLGRLHLQNSVGDIIEDAPYVYQVIDSKKIEVKALYILEGTSVSYHFPNGYNTNHDLIIDPTLIMSTYSGATDHYSTNCSAYDATGNLYVAGGNRFAGFPVSAGAYQNTYLGIGADNIAIQKFSPAGTLLFATYFGGEGDYPLDITINNSNELVILAATVGGFPVSATSAQPIFGGAIDYGIGILNNTGTALIGATYLGGSGIEAPGAAVSDNAAGLFIDATGAILVAGGTESADFPASAGAFQPALNGTSNGVIVAFDNTLNFLIWATHIGGSGDDICNSVAVGPNGNVYAVGNTTSNDFPVSAGGLNTAPIGLRDGFVVELSNTGNALIAGSYLGTPQNDRAKFIQINGANEVFVGGSTTGGYPISTGVFSSPSQNNLYIHKLDATLGNTIFSTAIGCFNTLQPEIFMTAMGLDYCEKIYFTGASTGNNFPITADAFTSAEKGLYMCVLEPDAAAIHYGSYFGGNVNGQHFHPGSKSKYNNDGILFHTECTNSTDYPIVNGINSANGINDRDGASFIFDFEWDQPLSQTNMVTPTGCNFPVTINAEDPNNMNVSYLWSTGETTSSIIINTNNEYKVLIYNFCDTIRDSVTVNLSGSIIDFSVVQAEACQDSSFTFIDESVNVASDAIYNWDFGDGTSSSDINPTHKYTASDSFNISLTITSGNCENTETKNKFIIVYPTPVAKFEFTPKVLSTKEPIAQFINTSSSDATVFIWNFSGVNTNSILQNPEVTYPEDPGKTYPVNLTVQNIYGCTNDITRYISVEDVISLYVPNAFTPASIGDNSVFQPEVASGIDPYNFRLLIFNRWGEIIFESRNYDKHWNGKYANEFVEEGAYIWQIDFKETASSKDHTFRGHVTVLR